MEIPLRPRRESESKPISTNKITTWDVIPLDGDINTG